MCLAYNNHSKRGNTVQTTIISSLLCDMPTVLQMPTMKGENVSDTPRRHTEKGQEKGKTCYGRRHKRSENPVPTEKRPEEQEEGLQNLSRVGAQGKMGEENLEESQEKAEGGHDQTDGGLEKLDEGAENCHKVPEELETQNEGLEVFEIAQRGLPQSEKGSENLENIENGTTRDENTGNMITGRGRVMTDSPPVSGQLYFRNMMHLLFDKNVYHKPTEQEFVDAYQAVAKSMAEKPVPLDGNLTQVLLTERNLASDLARGFQYYCDVHKSKIEYRLNEYLYLTRKGTNDQKQIFLLQNQCRTWKQLLATSIVLGFIQLPIAYLVLCLI